MNLPSQEQTSSINAFAARWALNSSPERTRFFARIVLAALPEPLLEIIRGHQLELLDWGCAQGDALPIFARAFPDSRLRGLDFAAATIAQARMQYPQWDFTGSPLQGSDQSVSLVYSSNCLVCAEDPLALLQTGILPWVKDYLILLLPYQESPLAEGHLVSLDAGSLPPRLDDMGMLFWRVIDTTDLVESCWQGQQLLVVYARRQATGIQALIPALMAWESQVSRHVLRYPASE